MELVNIIVFNRYELLYDTLGHYGINDDAFVKEVSDASREAASADISNNGDQMNLNQYHFSSNFSSSGIMHNSVNQESDSEGIRCIQLLFIMLDNVFAIDDD